MKISHGNKLDIQITPNKNKTFILSYDRYKTKKEVQRIWEQAIKSEQNTEVIIIKQ